MKLVCFLIPTAAMVYLGLMALRAILSDRLGMAALAVVGMLGWALVAEILGRDEPGRW